MRLPGNDVKEINLLPDNVVMESTKIHKISTVLITRDAANTIDRCLQALEIFEEVVICDTGSSDDTVERAGSYANVRLFKIEFSGFGSAKNAAISKAGNDWIFSLAEQRILPSGKGIIFSWGNISSAVDSHCTIIFAIRHQFSL